MQRGGGGSIVLIASQLGHVAQTDGGAIGPQDDVGIEHGQQPRDIAAARRRQEGVDDPALAGDVG